MGADDGPGGAAGDVHGGQPAVQLGPELAPVRDVPGDEQGIQCIIISYNLGIFKDLIILNATIKLGKVMSFTEKLCLVDILRGGSLRNLKRKGSVKW